MFAGRRLKSEVEWNSYAKFVDSRRRAGLGDPLCGTH